MNKTTKIIIWVIVAIVVVGGIWWWYSHSEANEYSTPAPAASTVASSSAPTAAAPAQTGNSDQAIEQDMTSINTQMNGFASDSASIDQGLNDQSNSAAQSDQF